MGNKRKRRSALGRPRKKQKPQLELKEHAAPKNRTNVSHPVLQRYYTAVVSLRDYLLSQLPASSKNRRRVIEGLGLQPPNSIDEIFKRSLNAEEYVKWLDYHLVGIRHVSGENEARLRAKELVFFSQQWTQASHGSSVASVASISGSDLVDFAIWLLFKRASSKPTHILCQGYQRASITGQDGLHLSAAPGILGILSHYPNSSVELLKAEFWSEILTVLGNGGDKIILDLLLDCGLFAPLAAGNANYYQLSGIPLQELQLLSQDEGHQTATIPIGQQTTTNSAAQHAKSSVPNGTASIRFVRNRMFYAKAALNAKGGVRFGLRHIHVLNRFKDVEDPQQTLHIMKYIFPRQFKLHNVFTSKVDRKETAQPFKDYTMREKEIEYLRLQRTARQGKEDESCRDPVPRRLRGQSLELVRKLRKLHTRCSYTELLHYYCKVRGVDYNTGMDLNSDSNVFDSGTGLVKTVAGSSSQQGTKQRCFTDLATQHSQVSVFVRACIKHVIPSDFLGDDDVKNCHREIIMRQVDRFISIRKFESLTLHEVMQDIKIAGITWLRPDLCAANAKLSRTDYEKRCEIFHEFVYYLFDSFVIPLVRSNFHVTESNTNKHQLYYFRHDVWRMLAEPALVSLKASTYEELKTDQATKILSKRALGFSQIRLLPKASGVRAITNLKRRIQYKQNGRWMLGRSINSILTPAFNALKYEKSLQPERMGSSLFSINDIYPAIKAFRSRLKSNGLANHTLFFAKVDVQSCFDTIPQDQLLSLLSSFLCTEDYRVSRHIEVAPPERYQSHDERITTVKPRIKFAISARAAGDFSTFEQIVEQQFGIDKSKTVFVDGGAQQLQSKHNVLQMISEHVRNNIVKIGKKFYRQKQGIPQGSILSTILCNLFYADFEANCLTFLRRDDTLLLRLIDDFLVISTEREPVERFLKTMHDGQMDYGVSVKKEKSLVNFSTSLDGRLVKCLGTDGGFPYCGVHIDTKSLDVSKEHDPNKLKQIGDSLTVDYSKLPGRTFHRKILNALKIKLHPILLDTYYNSFTTVLQNLSSALHDTAHRAYAYIKALVSGKQPHSSLVIKTVQDVASLTIALMRKRKGHKERYRDYRCSVSDRQAKWVVYKAFWAVFSRKQTKYSGLVVWLEGELGKLGRAKDIIVVESLSKVEK